MRPYSLVIAGLAAMALLGTLGGCVIDADIGDAPGTTGATGGGETGTTVTNALALYPDNRGTRYAYLLP